MPKNNFNIANWYLGTLANCGATCCTHPLDTLKVLLQTQQTTKYKGIQMATHVIRSGGIVAFYNGLSASLLRQISYSTSRFAAYEVMKMQFTNEKNGNLPFHQRVFIAGVAGACGGFIGAPSEMLNVRMQNDVKLPLQQRRNYKHVGNGFFLIAKEEGFAKLFRGASTATFRAILMAVGQLAFYDEVKNFLISTSYFKDDYPCYLTSSVIACAVATTMTHPVDVIKTRAMNAQTGEFKNLMHIISYTAKMGPSGFFKGYLPAFVRLGPHTVFTFILYEKLRTGMFPSQPTRDCLICQSNHDSSGCQACQGGCPRIK